MTEQISKWLYHKYNLTIDKKELEYQLKENNMVYVVLELYPYPVLMTTIDGEVWITPDIDIAIELKEQCECGFIVSIPAHLIDYEPRQAN